MADIKIYGTLKNAGRSGKVAYASQVFDETKGKFQSEINAEGDGGTRKFRYAHWNIGHFTYYDDIQGSSTPDIPAEDAEAMSIRYKKALNEIDADILAVCEDDPVFDAIGDTSIDMVYYKYGNIYQGTKRTYNCNSIYFNLPLSNIESSEVSYVHGVQDRYYHLIVATLNGKTVKIVETHLDFDQGDNGATYRAEQIQKLVSDFANDPYVIISGDFNVDSTEEYDAFAMAGFEMANHGYIGDLITYHGHLSPFNQRPLDNIVAKGFRMSDIKVVESTFDLSDHAAISCDLEMIV